MIAWRERQPEGDSRPPGKNLDPLIARLPARGLGPAELGGKAANLSRLLELGLPVPNWELLEELYRQLTDMERVLAACQLDELL